MSGKKGCSGGARPGAGRKPSIGSGFAAAGNPPKVRTRDPLKFLLQVMQGKVRPTRMQLKAARVAVAYMHGKPAAGVGKSATGNKKASGPALLVQGLVEGSL